MDLGREDGTVSVVKVHEGEMIEEAARRELVEEAGIAPADLEKVGVIDFKFTEDEATLQVHFFKTTKFEGEPKETEEMRPAWFNEAEIPYDKMFPDDRYWMPAFLDGRKFNGTITFKGRETNEIVKSNIVEVE